jgi:hypothetical protein
MTAPSFVSVNNGGVPFAWIPACLSCICPPLHFDNLLIPADDAFLPGINGGLGAVGQMKFAQDVADVSFNRIVADKKLCGDFLVAQSIGD